MNEADILRLIASIQTLTSIRTKYSNTVETQDYVLLNIDYMGLNEQNLYEFSLTLYGVVANLKSLSKFITAEKSINDTLPMNDENDEFHVEEKVDITLASKYLKYFVMNNYEDIEKEETKYKKVFKLYVEYRD